MLIGDDRKNGLRLQETLHGHPEGLQLRNLSEGKQGQGWRTTS